MITIRLFGRISVCSDVGLIPALSGKQRQILAILALNAGSPVSRDRLADLLWEGAPPASYVGTIDSYMCVLRRAMGLTAGRSSALATTAAGFVLGLSDDVEVDLSSFYRLARAADEGTGRPALNWAEEAMTLVDGGLLSEVPYAAWAVGAREEFGRTLVNLCQRGAQRANGLSEFESAARFARSAVDREPVCEEAWQQLMVAHWLSGSRGRALAAYAELRSVMANYLGDEPGQESQELYLTILRASSEATSSTGEDSLPQIRTLLWLLRQELELMPGVRPPALDAQLSEVAARALHLSGI